MSPARGNGYKGMAETAKKLNRAGHSHSGKLRIPYSFMQLRTMRDGRERKLSAAQLTAVGAIFSFSEGENVADFTCRELSERYRISKSSATRSINAALTAGLVKRMEKISKYKFEGDKGDGGFLLIEEWAYFAEFDVGNGKKEYLSQNDVRVLFHIVSLCRNHKGAPIGKDSYSNIARRLVLSKNTVISCVETLKSAKLIRASGRSWNGYTKMTFSVNEEELSKAKSAVIKRAKAVKSEIQKQNERTEWEQYYAHLRNVAEDRAYKMNEKAREDNAYRVAEQDLRELDIEVAKAEHYQKTDILALLLERQRKAQKQRAERLAAMGLTDDDLRPHYNCAKCSDTGFLPDGKGCDCYPARRGRP